MEPEQLYRVAAAAIRRVLGPAQEDMEDLVQTAVERVVRGLQSGQFSGLSSLPTWVTAIARHTALDDRRARQLDRSSLRSGVPAESVPTSLHLEDQLEARSVLDLATSVLVSMDELTAEIIVLHDVRGHSLSEIAEVKRLSVAAIQSRLVRGRRALLAQLKSARERS